MNEIQSKKWDNIKNRVISYYEETLSDYSKFWHTSKDLAIHYGFADKFTRTHSDILLNENKFLADIAHIKNTDLVLDAGCGVGGSAIWLAKNYGTRVIGISISPSQIIKARENARNVGVEQLTEFYEMDYHHTSFPDETFDVVWAIESFCHSPDKPTLFKEILRILKRGGRLIVADGFQKRQAVSEEEQKIFNNFTYGLAVYKTQFWDEFQNDLMAAGFINVRRWDKTDAIMPSAKRIYRLTFVFWPIVKILNMLKLVSKIKSENVRAGIAQYKALKKDLWLYGIYYAEK